MPRPILIDTDPGIDDAMAIFYALASPELEVRGLTTVFGNTQVEQTTRNALRLLEIAERADVPVAAGAGRPLLGGAPRLAHFVHGADGQGDTDLPAPQGAAGPLSAAAFIQAQARAAPGELTLVTLGPLTNVAVALLGDPELAGRLREIVAMGGNAFTAGNASPAAEANVLADPEAADIVLGADCPVTLIGLDVTERIRMSPAQLGGIGRWDNPRARHLARILPFYRAFYARTTGRPDLPIHDSTTVTYLLAPELFQTVERPIRVDTSAGLGRGKTWPALGRPDAEPAWAGRRPVRIAVDAAADAATRLELERLAR